MTTKAIWAEFNSVETKSIEEFRRKEHLAYIRERSQIQRIDLRVYISNAGTDAAIAASRIVKKANTK